MLLVQVMAEPDLEMRDLECSPDSMAEPYDESQVQQLLRLTDSLIEQGQALDGEIDAIYPADVDVRPASDDLKRRFFLELYDNGKWQEIMKMSQQTFFWLCGKMAPHIRKNDTNYREAIPVPCRLAACVYKLVTGCRSAEIMGKFGIGRSTLYSILRQVIPGIIEVLAQYIEWPRGQAFRATTMGIQEVCGFPNCAGVVGGCDIPIVAPSEDPWAYMNANQEYSVVLQVVCNHERKFTSVYVGQAGSMDFSGVLRSSSLFEKISRGALLTEDPTTPSPCSIEVKPYLLGDAGYPCLNWLMTPYKLSSGGGESLGPMQSRYNEMLLKGKELVDQSFAVLKSTFRELATPCLLDIELVPQVIGACCVLHNILVTRKDVQLDSHSHAEFKTQQSAHRLQGVGDLEAEFPEGFQDSEEALAKRDTLALYLANLPDGSGRVDSSTTNDS
ncbi:hypothetical protein Mp_8g06560 [Marchantia polymorpha subsp. ruderalis]|nr:hypothetical protein Mp_8g06560 [Marchantia polymorpha subsp. ruderalis]